MIPDHFSGTDLRRLCKGNLLHRPGRLDHPLLILFHMAAGALYHVPDTVDQPHLHINVRAQLHMGRLLGNKLRLCGGDGLPSCALGHLILRPLLLMLILHIRKHQKIHKALNESRFSRSDRAHNAQIYFSSRSALYIFIQVICTIL